MTVKSTRPSSRTNALLIVRPSDQRRRRRGRCPLRQRPAAICLPSAGCRRQRRRSKRRNWKVPLRLATIGRGSTATRRRCRVAAIHPKNYQHCSIICQDHPSGTIDYRPNDAFKVWNSVFAGDPCRHRFLRQRPASSTFMIRPTAYPRHHTALPQRNPARRSGHQPDWLAWPADRSPAQTAHRAYRFCRRVDHDQLALPALLLPRYMSATG